MSLSSDRNTPYISEFSIIREFPVAAGAKIYAGAMVALKGGYAKGAYEANDIVCVGRAEEFKNNSNGADGDITVRVRRNIFRYKNSASTDKITLSDIGKDCYAVDDETVAKTDNSGARSAAGRVFDVDDAGVWVEFYK